MAEMKLTIALGCHANAVGSDGIVRGTECRMVARDVEFEILPISSGVTLTGGDIPRPTKEIEIHAEKGSVFVGDWLFG